MDSNGCIFCKIIEGKIPSINVYKDNKCLVILDKYPATRGQSLVISKMHQDYILDLEDNVYNHMFGIAKKVGRAIDKALKTIRCCIVVEGFEVPHAHIRLHPSYERRLILGGKEADDNELSEIAEKIKKNM